MHLLITQMKFEPTIDLGSIIALVGMIASLYAFHLNNVKKITQIEQRVQLMWNTFKKRFNISDSEENEEDFLFR